MNLKREESVTIKFDDPVSGLKGHVTIETSVEGVSVSGTQNSLPFNLDLPRDLWQAIVNELKAFL